MSGSTVTIGLVRTFVSSQSS
ncbi:hypothetical protein Gorai_002693, partial [Gossypium raimondii]|nr:hypothetical protein [Gossypium raimondii]